MAGVEEEFLTRVRSNGMVTRRQVVASLGAAGLAGLVGGTKANTVNDKRSVVSVGRRAIIDAKPAPIEIDLGRTAVIVVDMQNDFGSKGGMFDRAGIDISRIQRAITPTAKILDAARRAGLRIIYLQMAFKPDLSDLGAVDSVNRVRHLNIMQVGREMIDPNGKPSRILVRDTWNTDIVDELKPKKGDVQLYKTRFSGFYNTNLHEQLAAGGVRDLIVTGCTTSICVDSTIRDAMFRDYRCVLLSDCTAEPIGEGLPRSNHEASLLTIEVLLGWVSDSTRFLKALAG